jgi:hypothetical protein
MYRRWEHPNDAPGEKHNRQKNARTLLAHTGALRLCLTEPFCPTEDELAQRLVCVYHEGRPRSASPAGRVSIPGTASTLPKKENP